MGTDFWGVENGYFDALGQWHDTRPDTHQAILAAMGVDEAEAVPAGVEPVRVVQQGSPAEWPHRGRLRLEDGATLAIDGCLPADLPPGYHEFHGDQQEGHTRVIVSPGKCILPSGRTWGWAAQLYSARSAQSWGIGDLADLRRLCQWSSGLGAGVVLVNPLSAADPFLPQEPSPYYPSSRRFLNPLHLRIEEVPGAADLLPNLEELASAGRALNARPRIDRDAVFRLKERALRRIWDRVASEPDFDRYRRQEGAPLEQFATYCALASRFGGDWRAWPEPFRGPANAAVREFRSAQAREVTYHQWLQWLLDRQLADAAAALPLVADVPVGVSPGGADAWIWQDLLAAGCTIGAPADAFNSEGQDWGVPPFVPHRLRAAGYEPFLQTIRAALRHARALRIDHVMGLFRLYWLPQGFGPLRGTYVRYRAEELLAILALESQRAGAFVVGEDLGTVEEQTRRTLAEHQVLSCRVLMFEGQAPEDYPATSVASLTTHDLPTTAGLWTGRDEAARRAIGLQANDLIFEVRRRLAEMLGLPEGAAIAEVIEAAYRVLARSPSQILLATLEDALASLDRPNMPGTTTEWPNWCLPLAGGLDALQTADLPGRIAQALSRAAGAEDL